MEKCYVCGNALEIIKDKPYEYTECGLNVLLPGITQYRCGSCEEEYADIPAPDELHKLIGLGICRSRKALLLPEEIKFLRKELGLKVKDLAALFEIEEAAVSRWENGKQQIGEGSCVLLRALYLNCRFEAVRQRIRKRAEWRSRNFVKPAPPRYDEVFFNGVAELFGDPASNQEPLGSEFEQVLHENLWDLYHE